MKTLLTSMMLSVALSFTMAGCAVDATDSTGEPEPVGEAEQAITVSGLCLGTDILPSGWRLHFSDGAWSAVGDGSHVASTTCNQHLSTLCSVMNGPVTIYSNYPCPGSAY